MSMNVNTAQLYIAQIEKPLYPDTRQATSFWYIMFDKYNMGIIFWPIDFNKFGFEDQSLSLASYIRE